MHHLHGRADVTRAGVGKLNAYKVDSHLALRGGVYAPMRTVRNTMKAKFGFAVVASVALLLSSALAFAQTTKPPGPIEPANDAVVGDVGSKPGVAFRWTPLIPRPSEPVTYRLKVWQLMQGQNGTQALKANQPIITKDVDNITQAMIPAPDCPGQKSCSFVWNVQALTRDGKPIGGNNGTSESFGFRRQPK